MEAPCFLFLTKDSLRRMLDMRNSEIKRKQWQFFSFVLSVQIPWNFLLRRRAIWQTNNDNWLTFELCWRSVCLTRSRLMRPPVRMSNSRRRNTPKERESRAAKICLWDLSNYIDQQPKKTPILFTRKTFSRTRRKTRENTRKKL